MNKILYEASYIGSARVLLKYLLGAIETIVVFVVVVVTIYTLKKRRREEEAYSGNKGKEYFLYVVQCIFLSIFAFVWGVIGWLNIGGSISTYEKVILGYKRGKYREVEGIVEDYADTTNGYTFTIDGIAFEVSSTSYTWGYTYSFIKQDQNVITEGGQHLRIRYIPLSVGSNEIVYIEEIAEE